MKKSIVALVLVFASAFFATDVNAEPNKAEVKQCLASGGTGWNENVVPHCVCPASHFNVRKPGKFLRYVKDYLDDCESLDPTKWSDRMKKPVGGKIEEKPAAVSTSPFMAKLTPVTSGETPLPAGTQAETALMITSTGPRGLASISYSCEGCLVNNTKAGIDNKPRPGSQAINYIVTPSGNIATKGGKAILVVEVLEKGSPAPTKFEFTAEWAAKEEPQSPCKKSGGTDAPNSHCYCPGDDLMESATAPYVCVPKPKVSACVKSGGEDLPASDCKCDPEKKLHKSATAPFVCEADKARDGRDGSSRLHLRIDPFAGYAKSDDFRTPIFGLALGVSFDFLTNLSGYVEGGMQFPGATRTDSANRPVLLSDGSKDKRSNSLMVEAGVEFQAAKYVMLSGGILFQALGVTAGQTNPVHSTLSAKFGVKVVAVQDPSFRLAIGPSVIMGVESRGNTPANFWFGGLLNVTMEVWNIVPWADSK